MKVRAPAKGEIKKIQLQFIDLNEMKKKKYVKKLKFVLEYGSSHFADSKSKWMLFCQFWNVFLAYASRAKLLYQENCPMLGEFAFDVPRVYIVVLHITEQCWG